MTRIIWLLAAYLLAVVAPPSPRYVGPAKWHGTATNKPITRITIHATVGPEPGVAGAAESTVNYSKNTDRPSSFHYIADSLHSLQYVYDSVVAYHAPPNEHSLGYEMCCSLSNGGKGHWTDKAHQDMLLIVSEDVARLCLHYDVPMVKLGVLALRANKHGISGHVDVSNAWHQTTHTDPGPYFPWKQFMNLVHAQADRLTSPGPKPVTPLTRGPRVDHALHDLHRAAKKLEKHPDALRKVMAATASLRSIKPKPKAA